MFKPKENISLAGYTTFGTGGPARYFYIADTMEDIYDALSFAKKNGLPLQLLGEGSNVLISDLGVDSFVLKMNTKGVEFELLGKQTRIIAHSGEKFDDVIKLSVENNLYGIENLSGIPGTVGASPIHNIGAYGVEVSDVIEWVLVLDMDNRKVFKLSNTECEFKYRSSIFKKLENKKLIILEVSFLLDNKIKINTEYKDIKSFFEEKNITNPTLNNVRDAIIFTRKQKLPNMKKFGTAGSFFKNPIVLKSEIKKLSHKYPELVVYPHSKSHDKISAGWLIDKVGGWKGYIKNDAGVSDMSALVLVNYGNAKSQDIFSLAERTREDIKNKTGVVLEYEVNLLGDF